MSARELDKRTYRRIIEDYFRAFETGDFSNVQFSSQVEFLSPLSGITAKGRQEVERFLRSVITRVAVVNVISIAVDFPTASRVWQMTTTKGVHTPFTTSFASMVKGSSTSGLCSIPRR